jgi:hypothetical protein
LWRVAALTVALLVLAGPLAPVRAATPEQTGPARWWSWLTAALPWPLGGAGLEQCSMIDPNGRCRAVTAEQGLMIDPDGREGVTSDQGLSIDPNG